MRQRLWAPAALALAAVLMGCVATPPNTEVGGGVTVPSTIVMNAPLSKVAQSMIRFRTVTCDAVYRGSGFAIDAHRIVTNRHVVGGASKVWAETWDGHELHVTGTMISPDNDLAIVTVSDDLDHTLTLAADDPPSGLTTHIVGYPLGKALRADTAQVKEIIASDPNSSDPDLNFDGAEAILFSGRIRHGNSGGPMVNDTGAVVGVAYRALSLSDSRSLAVPVSALHHVLDRNDLVPNPDCETFTDLYGGG